MIELKADYKNHKAELVLEGSRELFREGIRSALFEIGAENTQQAKKFLYQPPKTGRLYPYKNRIHQASAPGESPASRSGKLARSITYKVRGSYQVEFAATAYYGAWLEEGTKKMLPRPYITRTIKKKSRDNLRSLMKYVQEKIDKP